MGNGSHYFRFVCDVVGYMHLLMFAEERKSMDKNQKKR